MALNAYTEDELMNFLTPEHTVKQCGKPHVTLLFGLGQINVRTY